MPVYICFAERGWSVSDAAPASTSRGPTSRQVARAVLEAAAHLHRDRQRRSRSATASTIRHARVRVVEQRRAGAGLRHLAHRAAEVDVDDVGAGGLDHRAPPRPSRRARSRRSGSRADARRRRPAGSRASARCRCWSPAQLTISEQTSPAPKRRPWRRNACTLTPAIGASTSAASGSRPARSTRTRADRPA